MAISRHPAHSRKVNKVAPPVVHVHKSSAADDVVPRVAGQTYVDALGPELLRRIFSWLSVQDKKDTVSRVCKAWNHLLKRPLDPHVWGTVKMKLDWMMSRADVDASLRWIGLRARGITSVHLDLDLERATNSMMQHQQRQPMTKGLLDCCIPTLLGRLATTSAKPKLLVSTIGPYAAEFLTTFRAPAMLAHMVPVLQSLRICVSSTLNDRVSTSRLLPIAQLTNLETLGLTLGPLNDAVIPAEFGSLGKLKTLVLSHLPAVTALPATLSKLQSLQHMLNQQCCLTRFPDVPSTLTELCSLDLADNRLEGEMPFSLSGLRKLTSLVLSNNKLASLPGYLSQLPDLAVLNVSGNALVALPTAAVSSLTKLHTLNLSLQTGTQPFTVDESVSMIVRLPVLTRLVLSQGREFEAEWLVYMVSTIMALDAEVADGLRTSMPNVMYSTST